MIDDDIRSIVAGTSDVRDACKRLIAKANEHGGEDNITAVLIRIEEVKSVSDDDPDGDAPTREIEIPRASGADGAGGAAGAAGAAGADGLGMAEENTAPGVAGRVGAPRAIIHAGAAMGAQATHTLQSQPTQPDIENRSQNQTKPEPPASGTATTLPAPASPSGNIPAVTAPAAPATATATTTAPLATPAAPPSHSGSGSGSADLPPPPPPSIRPKGGNGGSGEA